MLQYLDFIAITSENLRLLRRIYGFTQDDIGEAIFLSHSAYAGIENGKTCLGFYSAYLISAFYDIPLEKLLDTDLKANVFKHFSSI